MTSLPSHTVVYTQTNMEEKLIGAVCGHPVLYDTAAVFYRGKIFKKGVVCSWHPGGRSWNRSELKGPRTGLRSAVPLEPVVIQTELLEETVRFPQLREALEDLMNQTRRRVVFQRFWDLYSRYSAAMVVTSAMIDVEIEWVEKKWFKNEWASASSFFSP